MGSQSGCRRSREKDAKRGGAAYSAYILDNEPALWNSTHRDIHPEPSATTSCSIAPFATAAVRAADPDAIIAGPAGMGLVGILLVGQGRGRGDSA